MDSKSIIKKIKQMANPRNVEGMARFGINPKNTLGVSVWKLRKIAKEIGKDHSRALEMWDSGIHEARLLAGFTDEPELVTEKQLESWVKDFDSWDVCDLVCSNLFDKTPFAYKKAFEWSKRKEEYVKRAGFVLMAALSVHDKGAPDSKLKKFFPVIIKHSVDERNFVRKAVNWALRQIGKRNRSLGKEAIKISIKLKNSDSRSARWVGSDAYRELVKKYE